MTVKGTEGAVKHLRAGVIDEHEIFRRGVVACLGEDPTITVIESQGGGFANTIDVAVVSVAAARQIELLWPTVVCHPDDKPVTHLAEHPNVYALLPRRTLQPNQLTSAVHAAAAGLRIESAASTAHRVSQRGQEVLRLLAGGADTKEIARELGYSERTIKTTIYDLENALGARNRAQAVAEAVRRHLI